MAGRRKKRFWSDDEPLSGMSSMRPAQQRSQFATARQVCRQLRVPGRTLGVPLEGCLAHASPVFRLVRILEVIAVFAALIAFAIELQSRSTDRAVRIATLHAQIAQTLDTARGRTAARASVMALASEDVSMEGINLMGSDLRGIDLSDADFDFSNLSGVSLNNANAQHGSFSGVNLTNADMSGADFSGADLSGSFLSPAGLSGARLVGTNLNGAHLSAANLQNANLSDAQLIGAQLDGAFLEGAILSGANLQSANLENTSLNGACYVDKPPLLPSGYTVPACTP